MPGWRSQLLGLGSPARQLWACCLPHPPTRCSTGPPASQGSTPATPLRDPALLHRLPPSFVLLVNKQGQTRLAKYTDSSMSTEERRALEAEIVRKCLTRVDKQCNIVEHRNFRVVYRRYASLFFLVGVDAEEVRWRREGWRGPGGAERG